MRIKHKSDAPWMKDKVCRFCKSVVDLESFDLESDVRVRTIREDYTEYFEWECVVCKGINKLILSWDNREKKATWKDD